MRSYLGAVLLLGLLVNGCATANFGYSDTVAVVAGPPPEYNVLIDPVENRSPLLLAEGEVAIVQFFIGSHDVNSVIGGSHPSMNLFSRGERATVTMLCTFCSEDTVQQQSIVYKGNAARSTIAVFRVRPQKTKTGGGSGQTTLTFSVAAEGVQYDSVVIPVSVGDTNVGAMNHPLPETISADIISDGDPVDILLTIADPADGFYRLAVTAQSERARTYLAAHKLDRVQPRWYRTGLRRADDLQRILDDNYILLRQAATQERGPIYDALRTSPNAPINLSPQSSVRLTNDDRDLLLRVLQRCGSRLYVALFQSGEADLYSVIRSIEAFPPAGKPLRIVVNTPGLHLPWQLLHPPGPPESNLFWGFKFLLSQMPLDRPQGKLTTSLLDPKCPGRVLFGRYRGDSPGDAVAAVAAMEQKTLTQAFGSMAIIATDSGGQFLTELRAGRDKIRVIITYTHATSGAIVTMASNDAALVGDVAGERLVFAKDSYLSSVNLDDLLTEIDTGQTALLAQAPIVLLNGCETGSPGVSPGTRELFPFVFARLGASTSIVTEAPVEKYFAFHFGNEVVRRLIAGEDTATAVHEAQSFFLTNNNPLGLLYTLYGNPGCHLAKYDFDTCGDGKSSE
jgi:hypothetical protein